MSFASKENIVFFNPSSIIASHPLIILFMLSNSILFDRIVSWNNSLSTACSLCSNCILSLKCSYSIPASLYDPSRDSYPASSVLIRTLKEDSTKSILLA